MESKKNNQPSTAAANDQYFDSALNAVKTRTYRAGVSAGLSSADREDLHQELILDLLERASQFDPGISSANTFTGMVSEHRTADFLVALNKDRFRLSFFSEDDAANDDPESAQGSISIPESAIPLWADDRDFFSDSAALHDLEVAIAYMDDEQLGLFVLLESHQDLPSACKASGVSSATFYRRVADLQMHLRMFGFKSAA